jgi:putative cell wall-binding protein
MALGAALFAGHVPAAAETDQPPERLAGPSRFHTAAEIATSTFEQADVAHLATGAGFADALAASYAAGSVDGPVLLTATDGVPSPTWEALEALEVETVVLIGGPGVIGEPVDDALADAGYATDRVGGATRFETASAVATRYGGEHVGTVDGQRTALLATGAHFADALAAGPIAARERLPLLLTPHDRPADSVTDALAQLEVDKIMLLGGPAAVSEAVGQHYRERGYVVERVGGPTAMDTAWLLADTAVHDFGFSHERVLLARGDDYPDALAASVHGAATGAPIVLSGSPTDLSAPTREWFTRTCPDVAAVTALGGEAAVSEGVRDDAVRASRACAEFAAEDAVVAVTADGRVVVLDPVTGEEVRELMVGVPTDDPAKNDIAVSPDGSEAYLTVPGEEAGERTDIVRVPTDGDDPAVVAHGGSPAVSPDGGTLAYAVHPGDVGDPDPRLIRRDLDTGEEVRLAGTDEPLHFVSDVSWTADGQQLALTTGEINTGVHMIDADATSMEAARRLGPGEEPDTEPVWRDTAAFDERLAVTELCCDIPPEQRWHVIDVDPDDGSIHGRLMNEERIEVTHLDSNAEASALLSVAIDGLDGGPLRRWNGAGEAHTVTDGIVAAAW